MNNPTKLVNVSINQQSAELMSIQSAMLLVNECANTPDMNLDPVHIDFTCSLIHERVFKELVIHIHTTSFKISKVVESNPN